MTNIEPVFKGKIYESELAMWIGHLIIKVDELIEAHNASLTEKKLPVECECEEVKLECPNKSRYGVCQVKGCGYCSSSKCEPEKTAESEWEKELDLRLKNWQGDIYYWKHDMKDFIRKLLTSHTEQKKKELREIIIKWYKERGGVYAGVNDILDLIKEL